MNWDIDKEEQAVRLVDPYTARSQDSIVPPTWDKDQVTQWPWNDVWREARRVLGQAQAMVVVGYSVPVTDQLSQALLRADVTGLRTLVVVNPDGPSRERVRTLLSSALAPDSSVIELGTFEELALHLRRAHTEPEPIDLQARIKRVARDVEWLQDQVVEVEAFRDQAEFEIEDIQDNVHGLQNEAPDIADSVRGLSDAVSSLEARVDSMVI